MSYCFNPDCDRPSNQQLDICGSCGAKLLLDNRYRGIKLLGRSQLTLTVEAEDLKSPGLKVVKILLTNYPKAIALFQQEAQILGQMNHPGIPKLATDGYFRFELDNCQRQLNGLAIEQIPGIDLEQWLHQQKGQRITEAQARKWLAEILDILSQLHQAQYFHRDIKPANIIVQPNGRLALIDFGAARKVSDTYLGKVGVERGVTAIGTLGYVAPEQLNGAALPQSDFFALGRTMIQLLTGKHPQDLPTDTETGAIIWRDSVPQISPAFASLLDSMTDHFPGRRPANVKAVSDYLSDRNRHGLRIKRKSTWYWVLGIAAVFLSALGFSRIDRNLNRTTTAQQESANPLCQNVTCINRDPIDNGCDLDAKTITSNIGNYAVSQDVVKAYRLEIRFSQACQATWARSEAPPNSAHYIEDSSGKKYGAAVVPVDQYQEHYADMAPGRNIRVRACAKPPSDDKRCTNFVQM